MPGYRGGYAGRILRVDLTNGKTEEEPLPGDDVLRQYVGSWGLSLRYLYDMIPPGYTATDPENPMIFMTGPLTGLPMPGATNVTLATKNFDTGYTVGRSHTHGSFGGQLKGAGFDGIIITGKSERPMYLWIHDGKAELRDAGHLWGKTDTHDTETVLQAELGAPKASVASIGPAGENLVAGGMIGNGQHHNFSHSGVGSVMGSKRLKAIAVSGDTPVPLADPARMSAVRQEFLKQMQIPGHLGWTWMRNQNLRRDEYRHRLAKTGFVGKNGTITQLVEFGLGWAKQEFTPKTCPRCPVGCPYEAKITNGPHEGFVATVSGGGEALEAAGAIMTITEPGTIYYLTDLYDHLGLEASAVGCTIAMAIEAYEKGLLTKKDTDGLELRWNDPELVETLARKMAHREGAFGELLAKGPKEAAEIIGGEAPEFAMHVKGAGMNLHEWRPVWGVLFGQIVGSGAGWPAPGADCFTVEPDAGFSELQLGNDPRTKPLEARNTGKLKFLNDSTGMCMLVTWGMHDILRLTSEALSVATGWDYTREELLEVGERVMQLERAFNVRHGLKPDDDWTVPKRITEAPADGPAAGIALQPHLKGMVEEYHRLMGWDAKTGKPTRARLCEVGLDDVARDLWG